MVLRSISGANMIPRLLVLLFVSALLGAAQSEPAELNYKVDAEWAHVPSRV